jgi:membrane protease YdiL (CAAX protease family)
MDETHSQGSTRPEIPDPEPSASSEMAEAVAEILEFVPGTAASAPPSPGSSSTAAASPLPLTPPGPGLPESMLWMIGLMVVQFAGALFGGIIVVVAELVQHGADNFDMHSIQKMLEGETLGYISIAQGFFLVVTMLAAALRLRSMRRLPMGSVSVLHVILLVALLLPMGIISSEVYRLAKIPWDELAQHFPVLKDFDALNVMNQMEKLASGPLPLVLFAMAVVPAIAEELLFRGVIGRGLTARWGLPAGIFMTSILFALPHAHPLHVIGVIPLGIVIHLTYYATRSFWSPMFVHFMNNAMAAGMAMAAKHLSPDLGASDDEPVSRLVLMGAIAVATTSVILMWKTRARYVLPDGSEWTPGYPTTDAPPPEVQATSENQKAWWLWYVLAMASVVGFVASFGPSIREAAQAK